MAKVKHFSIASKDSESLSGYLRRLSDEIDSVSETNVVGLCISQPDKELYEEQIVGTVYLADSAPVSDMYEMDCYTKYVTAEDSRAALTICADHLIQWMAQKPGIEIYDIVHEFGVDKGGKDVVKMSVFYSTP